MFRVATIVGTRPEIIRLSRVIAKLDEHFDHTLIHTGQNYDYELNTVFFEELEIRKPDVFLEAAGSSAAETIGTTIIATDKILESLKPSAVLILGDTNSSLAAISAKRRKIPIFHMEAGNRCFDLRVPEEINRKIVDHIADINLPYSSIARDYLIAEGLSPDQIIKTGSPMAEVLGFYQDRISSSEILSELSLKSEKYFLVSVHREENVDNDKSLSRILSILNMLCEVYGLPVVVSTHPRTKKRLSNFDFKINSNVHFMKPFGFCDYVKLQHHAKCVLSDSGTISEESSILNFPAINLREVNERPEAFEEGAVMMTGLDESVVRGALEILDRQPRGEKRLINQVLDYKANNVSDKVVRIIASHTGFVDRRTWQKY